MIYIYIYIYYIYIIYTAIKGVTLLGRSLRYPVPEPLLPPCVSGRERSFGVVCGAISESCTLLI